MKCHRLGPGLVFVVAVLMLTAAGGCTSPTEVPTLFPTAVVPTAASPTSALIQLPPTRTIVPTPLSPTVTPVVALPLPTELSSSGVHITTSSHDTHYVQGEEVTVGGLVVLSAGEILSVTLTSATGHILAATEAEVQSDNSWQTTFDIPYSVSGAATLVAQIKDASGYTDAADELDVNIVVDVEESDRYLTLYRPANNQEAAAGFQLFFDGQALLPANNVVTISLWNDSCQKRVATQSYVLRGSGYWQGFVVVPRDAAGEMCAVASFGEEGEETWREAQVRINITSFGQGEAPGVEIGNPPPDSVIDRGRTLLLYGTAYNTPDSLVFVAILLENGRVLNEGVAGVDYFGYWEIELFIPADAIGKAEVSASIGDPASDAFAEHKILISVE